MILKELRIKNFRSYYGDNNHFEFSDGLTLILGDNGDGKTTFVLNIAAKLSNGESLDKDMKLTEPLNIIYQTAEDGLADTVKPRLELAGADCEKIMVIDESNKSLSILFNA